MRKTLYLLGNSPVARGDRDVILRTARAGDVVLLHQDGVFGLVGTVPILEELRAVGVRLMACLPDCRARGIPPPADAVDWAGFVRLIEEHERVVS